jgi:hypothetical protein
MLSDEQTETVKTSKMNRLFQAIEKGVITSEEVVHAINKDELLPVKVEGSDIDFLAEKQGDTIVEEKNNADELALGMEVEKSNEGKPVGDWYAELYETIGDKAEKIFECYGKTENEVIGKCQEFEMKEIIRRKQFKQGIGFTEIKTKKTISNVNNEIWLSIGYKIIKKGNEYFAVINGQLSDVPHPTEKAAILYTKEYIEDNF